MSDNHTPPTPGSTENQAPPRGDMGHSGAFWVIPEESNLAELQLRAWTQLLAVAAPFETDELFPRRHNWKASAVIPVTFGDELPKEDRETSALGPSEELFQTLV